MTFRYSVELRNAGLDARMAAVGPSPVLKIYSSGPQIGKQATGELISIQLEDGWMSKADDGVSSNTGDWRGTATGDGKAKSFRIYDKSGRTCHIEGAIPDDLKLDNPNIATGQTVTVTAFTVRSGNG